MQNVLKWWVLPSLGMAAACPTKAAEVQQKPSAKKDNLVFILVDQLRYDALSCMGNTVIQTPNLDRLAREGVLFKNAYTAAASSTPARTALLTGTYIYTSGVLSNRYGSFAKGALKGNEAIFDQRTYDEVLIENGYRGEYYGKWHSVDQRAFAYSNRPIGTTGGTPHPVLGISLPVIYSQWLDNEVPKKEKKPGDIFYRQMGRYYAPDPMDPRYQDPESNKKGEAYTLGLLRVDEKHTRTAMDSRSLAEAIRRLNKEDAPFTIHCSYGPPHPPLLVCEKYHSMLDPQKMPLMPNFADRDNTSPYWKMIQKMGHFQDPSTLVYMIRNYWAMVKELDDWMGVVFQTLEEVGIEENTMVIFTADHGEMLGAHGMNGKACFYDESARVPFIIRYPKKIKAGTVVEAPVETAACYATIMDYLGVEPSAQQPQIPSLRSLIEKPKSKKAKEAFAISEWDSDEVPGEMIRTARWKLMVSRSKDSKTVDALYDMVNDPYERHNLLFAENYQKYLPIANQLKDQLADYLRSKNIPTAQGVAERVLTTRK